MGLGAALSIAAPIVGGLLGGSEGGESSSQTQTRTSEPWEAVQPYLRDLFGKAQGMQEGFMPSYFPGQTFAPFDPLQVAAQRMAQQYITGSSELPEFNVPQNLPSAAPTYAPPGAFPFFDQGQYVAGGSPAVGMNSAPPQPVAPPPQQNGLPPDLAEILQNMSRSMIGPLSY